MLGIIMSEVAVGTFLSLFDFNLTFVVNFQGDFCLAFSSFTTSYGCISATQWLVNSLCEKNSQAC